MRTISVTLAFVSLLSIAAACGPHSPTGTGGTGGGPSVRERPAGPAADVSQELSGGNGIFVGSATGTSVPAGYVQNEYLAAGTATAYAAQGTLTDDGHWTFEPSTTAPYRTRIIVRRP